MVKMAEALPIYKIKGKFYFRDVRLQEYRNVENPSERLHFDDVRLSDFQKPTKIDTKKINKKYRSGD